MRRTPFVAAGDDALVTLHLIETRNKRLRENPKTIIGGHAFAFRIQLLRIEGLAPTTNFA